MDRGPRGGHLVWGLIFWSIVCRRRKDRHRRARQLRYNLPVEIMYTVVPLI